MYVEDLKTPKSDTAYGPSPSACATVGGGGHFCSISNCREESRRLSRRQRKGSEKACFLRRPGFAEERTSVLTDICDKEMGARQCAPTGNPYSLPFFSYSSDSMKVR